MPSCRAASNTCVLPSKFTCVASRGLFWLAALNMDARWTTTSGFAPLRASYTLCLSETSAPTNFAPAGIGYVVARLEGGGSRRTADEAEATGDQEVHSVFADGLSKDGPIFCVDNL